MLLENNENLEIEITESILDCNITVNGYGYVTITDATIEEIDLNDLVYWIKETYYSDDYKSSAYIAPSFHLSEFSK